MNIGKLQCLVSLVFLTWVPVSAQEPYTPFQLEQAEKQVFQQLKSPWYKVELILFERLPVLRFNTEEELIATALPTIPNGISEFAQPGTPNLSASWQPDLEWCYEVSLFPDQLGSQESLPPHSLPPHNDAFETGNDDPGNASAEPSQPATPAAVNTPPTERDIFTQALAEFEQILVDQSLTALDDLRLETEVKLINRRRHLRPILHLSWIQVPTDRDSLVPLTIAAPESSPRVFGTLGLSLGRYLHFAADLSYQPPAVAWRPLPAHAQPTSFDPNVGYIHFRESRRMRSGELHYLDHPKMGIIVRVDPVKIPDRLVHQFLQLETP